MIPVWQAGTWGQLFITVCCPGPLQLVMSSWQVAPPPPKVTQQAPDPTISVLVLQTVGIDAEQMAW